MIKVNTNPDVTFDTIISEMWLFKHNNTCLRKQSELHSRSTPHKALVLSNSTYSSQNPSLSATLLLIHLFLLLLVGGTFLYDRHLRVLLDLPLQTLLDFKANFLGHWRGHGIAHLYVNTPVTRPYVLLCYKMLTADIQQSSLWST